MAIKFIQNSFKEAQDALTNFVDTTKNFELILYLSKKIVQTVENGGKIFSCGNGGSMCDAMHFAEELTGRFKKDRNPLPAISISDPAHLSCTANDYGYEYVFSRFIEGLANPGDMLLGISTSGNSQNIIEAVKMAKKKQMFTFCLTGKEDNILSKLSDKSIMVPANSSDRIQELHIKIIHATIEATEHLLEKI